jgi:hypothetical protein
MDHLSILGGNTSSAAVTRLRSAHLEAVVTEQLLIANHPPRPLTSKTGF